MKPIAPGSTFTCLRTQMGTSATTQPASVGRSASGGDAPAYTTPNRYEHAPLLVGRLGLQTTVDRGDHAATSGAATSALTAGRSARKRAGTPATTVRAPQTRPTTIPSMACSVDHPTGVSSHGRPMTPTMTLASRRLPVQPRPTRRRGISRRSPRHAAYPAAIPIPQSRDKGTVPSDQGAPSWSP